MTIMLLGEIFERLFNHKLVIPLVEFPVGDTPKHLALFVRCPRFAIPPILAAATIRLPIAQFVLIIPRSMFRRQLHLPWSVARTTVVVPIV